MRDKLEDFKLRVQYSYELAKSAWRYRKFNNTLQWSLRDLKWAWSCDLDAYNCCSGFDYYHVGSCGCYGMTNRDVMQRQF